jgi:large subunit ribosomal protein L3
MAKSAGLIGRKIGMTQIFSEDGTVNPVTVIEAGPCSVLMVKTTENNGYNAVQLGFGSRKDKHTTKAQAGHFAKAGVAPARVVKEFRMDKAPTFEVGSSIGTDDLFKEGQRVDVTGTSKGCGFAGVMKRHNFAGFISSHGTHEFFRHGGSIGCSLTPGRVAKGKKMPGHMGNRQITCRSLPVINIDNDQNLLLVKGSVPGPNNGMVLIKEAKRLNRKKTTAASK